MKTQKNNGMDTRQVRYKCKGNVIERLRDKANLSQEQLGELVGVSRNSYRDWENGGGIEYLNAVRLSEILNVNMEEIFEIPSKQEEDCMELEELVAMIDAAYSNAPEKCFELLKNNSMEFDRDEKDIAEKYYYDPDEYNPEIGLDLGLMNEDTIKEEILMCILQKEKNKKKKNNFQKSMEETRAFLNGPVAYSKDTIKILEEETMRCLKAIENQEISCEWQEMEKLMGRDFALLEALHSMK